MQSSTVQHSIAQHDSRQVVDGLEDCLVRMRRMFQLAFFFSSKVALSEQDDFI